MDSNFIITTTNNLEGYEIEKYYGYVSVNFVTGANFIRDIFASFSDTFGGISQSYTDELDELKAMAIESLKSRAQMLGMNGIIGINVDLNPIFGSGYSMFMVSATGTAVKINGLDKSITEEEKMEAEILRSIKSIAMIGDAQGYSTDFKTIPLLKLESFLLIADKEYSVKIIENLLEYTRKNPLGLIGTNLSIQRKIDVIKTYLHKIDREVYIKTLLGNVDKENVAVMKALEIIDYGILLKQFEETTDENKRLVLISSLGTVPQVINKVDFEKLGNLIKYLDSKYNNEVDIKSVGMIKKSDMWLCKKCKVPCELTQSSCTLCQYNRYGLPSITKYNDKITMLKNIYNLLEKYYR